MKKFVFYSIQIFSLFAIAGCSKDDDLISTSTEIADTTSIASESYSMVNDWISENMSLYYYWNTSLPASADINEYPEDFFYNLLHSSDYFSFITDDAAGLIEEFSGTTLALGFSSAFGKFNDSDQVFMIVEYVYNGSSAFEQGLKRGDIILKINGEYLDTDNYYDLYSQSGGYSVTLGAYIDGTIYETSTTYDIAATYLVLDPIIDYEVKEVNGIKIGYIVYVEFIAGDNNLFLSSMDQVMGELKSQGITELVVDLRYNPGGELTAAQHLASLLAPASATSSGEAFVTFNYNDDLQNYFLRTEGSNSDNLKMRLETNSNNLNLSRIFFLTTNGSASASELVINGLEPYMDVVVIGEPTYGKYYGSYVIYNTDTPPAHNWAIIPVVMKYANSLGVTDFVNGLTPDVYIEDDLFSAKEFGNITDPMLASAIEQITGLSVGNARTVSPQKNYSTLLNKEKIARGNVMGVLSPADILN
ncbi:MAG: S41 family peptidase [Imperialibacter sp.]|uniref:S41 family peptidase n=1 Tax=Imperialibacter sp. TaxID=2038411 RepID=UPI003A8B1200